MPYPTKIRPLGYPRLEQTSASVWHVRFWRPAEDGDTLILCGQIGSGSDLISTIVDDQGRSLAGGAWVKDKTQVQATDNQFGYVLRSSNVPAGTREVTITLSAPAAFDQWTGMMVNMLATSNPVAASASGNPTGKVIAAGNLDIKVPDTFVVTWACCTSGAAVPPLCQFWADGSYELWAVDPVSYSCGMYGPQPTAGIFNPTLTPSKSWTRSIAMAVAYKTAAGVGGLPRSGVEVRSVQVVNFNTVNGNTGTTLGPFNVPIQNGCNAIAMAFDDGNGIFNSNPKANTATNPANTFDGTPVVDGGGNPLLHHIGWVYKVDANLSPQMTMTLTVTASPQATSNGFVVFIFGLANAAFDTFQSGSGTSASVPPVTLNNILSSALVTSAPGVALLIQQEERQTPTNIVPTNGTFSQTMEDVGQYEGPDCGHDTGWGVQDTVQGSYNYNVSFSDYEGGLNIAEWSAQVIAFKTSAQAASRGSLSPNARVG